MARKYNVVFKWTGKEEVREEFPDLYITHWDGSYMESRTWSYMKEENINPRALGIRESLEIMEACNLGKFCNLPWGYTAFVCDAIELTPTGYKFPYLECVKE